MSYPPPPTPALLPVASDEPALIKDPDGANLLVFREVAAVEEPDGAGGTIEVAYCESKRIWETDTERQYSDGEQRIMTPLFLDAQGRIYHHRLPLDMTSSAVFVRDGERGTHLHFLPFAPTLHARDLLGRPITAGTPAGPAFHELSQ